MIVSVGEWGAAARSRRIAGAGRRLGCKPIHVAVNCSPLQLRRPGFTELVLRTIEGWTGGRVGPGPRDHREPAHRSGVCRGAEVARVAQCRRAGGHR